MTSVDFKRGGYRYLPGVFQFSGGVAALDGFRIERAMFHSPVPLAEGFGRIEAFLTSAGRPLTALCACELRSPMQMNELAFRRFNELYVDRLSQWGITSEGANPVARSNVCPQHSPPAEASFHAFSFTVEDRAARPSFVIAGTGEVPEGQANYRDHIVRLGDTSSSGLKEKARFVLNKMEARLASFGLQWPDASATQIYTVHDLHPLLADEIVARGAAAHGVAWHYCRPPVVGLEFEMDCRGIDYERVI
jgi:hypothetical protein